MRFQQTNHVLELIIPDVIFSHKEAKYNALVQEIIKIHSSGRPMLIGTCSVEESEFLAEKLKAGESRPGFEC